MNFIKKRFVQILNGIPLNLFIVNLIFQKVFCIDRKCMFSKNYTSRVICPEKLEIEGNSRSVLRSLAISGGCYIQACGGIIIGQGTIWSFNVSIISQDHDINDFSKIPKREPIRIGRDCWLGACVTILPGVVLGDRTIVGANSVVTKSFPDGNIVIAGCPAKPIRKLN